MNGYSLTLLSAIILPALSFAANNGVDKTKMYQSKLGCMACHQTTSLPIEKNKQATSQKSATIVLKN